MADRMRAYGCVAIILAEVAILATVGVLYLSGRFSVEPRSGEEPVVQATVSGPPASATAAPLVSTRVVGPTPTLALSTPTSTPSPSATPSPSPTATRTSLYPRPVDEEQVEAILANLSLEQKIGQMLMVGLPTAQFDEVAWRRVVQQGVGGVIFLERNTTSPQQVVALTGALQAAALEQGPGLPLLIGWNHEGGPVARTDSGVTKFPSAMALGAANRPELVYEIGQAVGSEMRSLGVNVNFAPVLDVNVERANPVIGLRSYGEAPSLVAELGQQYIRGQQSAGIIAVAKHFPGHGGVDVDSHLSLPTLNVPPTVLRQTDLPPFQSALDAGVASVMVAHIQIPALEPDGWPASLSPPIVSGLLRQEMGFDGVVMTDDMGMGAVRNNYGLGEAAVQAVLAGNDLLLTVETQSYPDIMRSALLSAVTNGTIPRERIDEAVRRLIRLKLAYDLSTPPSTAPLADQAAHLQLAQQAGQAAVRIVRDDAGWLPLNLPTNTILLISPDEINPGTTIGDGLSLIGEALVARGIDVTEHFYIPEAPWSVAQVQSEALAASSSVDAIVVVTWNAILRYTHYQEVAQESLVNELLSTGRPVVVVFGQLPYDGDRVPNAPAQIATYGDTPGQVEGLISLLLEAGGPQ